MKIKTQILLAILVIFLTVGCVSAADDDVQLTATSTDVLTTTSIGMPAPTYYNITEDSYSSYFDENGTFTFTPSEFENSVVRLGNLENKTFIFNSPNLTISKLDTDSILTDSTITLNPGAEGTMVTGLKINTNLYDVVVIDNYASNIEISENDITVAGEALYTLAAIVVHDSENIRILDNTITVNATGQYAYGIDLYTNYVENATISNALITGNTINGVADYYLAGLSAMNGVTNSIISDNVINVESTNLTYGIATANNYANSYKSGNLTIENNIINLKSDMAYGIESASQIDMLINNNTIVVEANGAEGIASIGLENSTITNNNLNLVGGTLTNSYWDSIPNDNIGIFLYGAESNNVIANNEIVGTNVDGISVRGSNNNINENIINLTSDENIQVSSYGSSMVMGIEAPGSENTITSNDITVAGDATYNYGIDTYAPVYGENINDVVIKSNNVNVLSDSNYGAGIYASGLSDDSIIDDNEITVASEGMGYGVAVDGAANSTAITNNDITVSASNARGIEVTNLDDSQINNNNIEVIGDATYGIAGYFLSDSEVNNNEIEIVPGNLSAAYAGWDYVPAGQAPIALLNSTDDSVVENTLVNEFDIETTGSENILVENNTNLMEDALVVEPAIIQEGSGANFTGLLLDANGNPIVGHHLLVNLTRTSSGASKVYEVVSDYNGEFQLPINLASGDYTAQVSYDGITLNGVTYADARTEPVSIKVAKELDDRTATVLTAPELTKTVSEEANFTGTLSDLSAAPIAGQHVKVTLTRTSSGASKTYDVVTDFTGKFSLPITLAAGAYTAQVSYDGTTEYQPASTSTIAITVTA